VENTEIQEVNIVELVGDLNSTAMTKSLVMEKYGMKDGKLRRFLKNGGYEYNQKNGKWQQISESNNTANETKVTYRIPVELYKAVKLQAIFEGVNATDIIVKALNDYIPKATKEIVEQNKK
jgi:predicted DNA binding CopG/RHH family protein